MPNKLLDLHRVQWLSGPGSPLRFARDGAELYDAASRASGEMRILANRHKPVAAVQ
jgi:hypothetical protein